MGRPSKKRPLNSTNNKPLASTNKTELRSNSSPPSPLSPVQIEWSLADASLEAATLEQIALPDRVPKSKKRKRKKTLSSTDPSPGEQFSAWFNVDKSNTIFIDGADEPLPLAWFDEFSPSSSSSSSSTPTSSTLQSHNSQLAQIKLRLNPAAEALSLEKSKTTYQCFHQARLQINPFEILNHPRNGLNPFLNRAAIKLANLDAILFFQLSSPPKKSSTPFKFVDLCGAPGGFSEYLIYRTAQNNLPTKGWGMSLAGENPEGIGAEWKIDDPNFTVTGGADQTGDIYNFDNVRHLKQQIDGGGVHLVLADGGFDAQRDSDQQELLAQKLVAHQVSERSERALMNEDEKYMRATTNLSLFSIFLARSPPPCSIKYAHNLALLGAACLLRTSSPNWWQFRSQIFRLHRQIDSRYVLPPRSVFRAVRHLQAG